MRIDIKLPEGAELPRNAHASDTGYDLVAASDPVIVGERAGDYWRSISYIEYDTGISVAPGSRTIGRQANFGNDPIEFVNEPAYLLIYPRSSISKTNLLLANSVAIIDNAYRGTIKLRFRYLMQPCDWYYVLDGTNPPYIGGLKIDQSRIYQRGDKIGQAVAAYKEAIEWRVVESLGDTVRGAGGWGSTDEKSRIR